MSDNNAPSAFPTPSRTELRNTPPQARGGAWYEHHVPSKEGMDLRDYFAANILTGLLANAHNDVKDNDAVRSITEFSYDLADAMMLARQKRGAE